MKEGDTKGIQGFVKVLEAIRHDGMKINGDDLPRFLDRSFRSVSVRDVIFISILWGIHIRRLSLMM